MYGRLRHKFVMRVAGGGVTHKGYGTSGYRSDCWMRTTSPNRRVWRWRRKGFGQASRVVMALCRIRGEDGNVEVEGGPRFQLRSCRDPRNRALTFLSVCVISEVYYLAPCNQVEPATWGHSKLPDCGRIPTYE